MSEPMKVAVVLGGTNEERNVSLATGRAVVAALRERGHEVVAVDPAHGAVPPEEEARMLGGAVGADPPGIEELARLGSSAVGAALADLPAVRRADVVFLALHGEYGEDGTVQGLLDLAGIAYTGSGCLGSAAAFDKRISKELFAYAGVPTPKWTEASASPREIVEALGLPLVVKPTSGGSTVGLTVVRAEEEVNPAIELAARYDVHPNVIANWKRKAREQSGTGELLGEARAAGGLTRGRDQGAEGEDPGAGGNGKMKRDRVAR